MHTHSHGPAEINNLNAAFKGAVLLNTGFVVLEAVVGFGAGSLALLADAAHNLTDVSGLLIAWGAVVAAKKQPNNRFTYGYGRSTILAALLNAVFMLGSVGAVLWEAVGRFSHPVDIAAIPVAGVAFLGIGVNAGTAFLFHAKRKHDLNVEGAFLHMATDAAVSLGVVLAAGVVYFTGWAWVDPVVAILVSVLIAGATFGLLRASFRLTLDAVPASVDREGVKAWLSSLEGVSDVHDLHIWALSTTKTALTAHLLMPKGSPGDDFLEEVADELAAHYNIQHTTLQIETNPESGCHACEKTP